MIIILSAVKISLGTGLIDDPLIDLALPVLDLLFERSVGHFVLFFWNLFHIVQIFLDWIPNPKIDTTESKSTVVH